MSFVGTKFEYLNISYCNTYITVSLKGVDCAYDHATTTHYFPL